MLLFPPAEPVVVVVNGRPVTAYARPFAQGGRVFVPLRPFITRLADRLWHDGNVLVIARDGRSVRVRLPTAGAPLGHVYVAIAPLLRSLGERVWYEARGRMVEVVTPQAADIAAPRPYDPLAARVTPRTVFTPTPIPTPRPIWSGSPQPRRTPIPIRTRVPPAAARRG